MKTKEEIDELYHKYWDEFSSKYDDNLHYYSFVEGYTQCQEDMSDKKYTEEDVRKCWILATNYALNQSNINLRSFINSLNKQD